MAEVTTHGNTAGDHKKTCAGLLTHTPADAGSMCAVIGSTYGRLRHQGPLLGTPSENREAVSHPSEATSRYSHRKNNPDLSRPQNKVKQLTQGWCSTVFYTRTHRPLRRTPDTRLLQAWGRSSELPPCRSKGCRASEPAGNPTTPWRCLRARCLQLAPQEYPAFAGMGRRTSGMPRGRHLRLRCSLPPL